MLNLTACYAVPAGTVGVCPDDHTALRIVVERPSERTDAIVRLRQQGGFTALEQQ